MISERFTIAEILVLLIFSKVLFIADENIQLLRRVVGGIVITYQIKSFHLVKKFSRELRIGQDQRQHLLYRAR